MNENNGYAKFFAQFHTSPCLSIYITKRSFIMEMYDYIMLFNVLATVFSVLISYQYVSKMVLRKGAFLFHTVISVSFVVFTWFVTSTIWYLLTFSVDELLYIGGMLFNMIFMILCITVLIAYLIVMRPYFMKKYSSNR
jgi:hypothetical protein